MNIKHKSTLEKYKNILRNEFKYSESTIKTYTAHLKEYLNYFDKSPIHLTYKDYKWFIQNHKFEHSKHNQFVSSVKLFYRHILNYTIKVYLFKRPRKQYKLPDILSQEEIKRLIGSITNLKHKCIIATIYYFGLRRSECINVKMQDFCKDRKQLHIKQSKGAKDRNIPFQDSWISIANKYALKYKPKVLLFEGQNDKYSATSIAKILQRSLKKCKINKNIHIHSLRHSYAVHLLENGVDIYKIKEYLGHRNMKTTENYLQMTNKCYDHSVL